MMNFTQNGSIVKLASGVINLQESAMRLEEMRQNSSRYDSNSFFIYNEGKTIDQRVIEAKRPNDAFFLGLMNANTAVGEFDDTYEWSLADYVGDADFVGERNTEFKTVDVSKQKFLQNIGLIATQVFFKETDYKDPSKAEIIYRQFSAASKSILRRMRQVFFDGYAQLGINGLFSHSELVKPAITSEIQAGATTTKKLWAEKSSKEIVKDIVDAYQSVVNATSGAILPNTLLVSQAAFAGAMPETTGQLSAFQEFLRMTESEVASRLGVENGFKMRVLTSFNNRFKNKTNGFVFFCDDPECVEQIIPTVFKTYPIFTNNGGLHYSAICVGRTGGLVVRQPYGFAIRYGI